MDGKVNTNTYISLNKCRERRLWRREMRLMASETQNALSQQVTHGDDMPDLELKLGINQFMQPDVDPASLLHFSLLAASSSKEIVEKAQEMIPILESPPIYGLMAVSGKMLYMEDTVSLVPNLCRPKINHHRPLHFFGLFDGHGGVHIADLCKDLMHVIMEEELMRVGNTGFGYNVCSIKGKEKEEELEKMLWMDAIKRCFERMDEVALDWCPCGRPNNNQCICPPMHQVFPGSTAVVALLTPELIVVANCGDSRAVLCRAGKCVPLTSDHKPDRADELARINACGGQVLYLNGARVEGILAMSRAMGDKFLKPVVTSEPEICFMKRSPMDECLILASDGLWDVMSNELACEVASNCLRDGGSPCAGLDINNPPPPLIGNEGMAFSFPSTSAFAAAILTRLALGRGSSDNISVVVVDLRM